MNKILTDTCQCGCNPELPENLLKITAGNDFSIKLQLTEKIDDKWVHYDMTDMSNVTVSVMSPNNTATELDYIIDTAGNIQAIVDAQKFQSYIIYGIEVLWTDATDVVSVDKRAYAPNVFAFVNSSMEATDSSYEYTSDNPYEYNISMSNDVVLLSIGYVPDVDMSNYYTKDEIDSTLENYATDQDVADAISTIDLSNYVTNSSLSTTLQDYETKSELSTTLKDYAQLSDLSDYVTTTSLNNTLNDYVTDSELTTTLNPYVTKQYVDTEISTSLNPYATKQYVDDAVSHIDTSNFYTKSEIDTTLEDYALYDDINNYNNTISTALIEHQRNILDINSNFNNYYNKTASDSRYVTASQVASQYVNNSSLDNVTQTTAASLNDLNSRVTTLEQGGGGGGGTIPSNVVTSDDGNKIVCLTQSEYDTLEQNGQLDSNVFYYITDTTSNYVTNSSLTTTLADYATDTELQTAIGNIPTVNNATLTIQKNGTTVNTFTANASSNVTANITVPTDLSELTDNNGVIPTVPSATSDLNNDSGFVSSSSITTILQISQSDYDTLVNNSQVDANTLYIIV